MAFDESKTNVCRLLCDAWLILEDGPDDSDKESADRKLGEAIAIARQICRDEEADKTTGFGPAPRPLHAKTGDSINRDLVTALLTAERFLCGTSYNAAQLADAVSEIRAALAKAGA